MNISQFAPFLAFCLLTAPLPADVTYVDATMANTNNAAGGPDSTWLDGNDGSTGGTVANGLAANDGLWRYRAGFGSNGIFEATGSTATAENAVPIVTTLSGLADGTYDIYVFFRGSPVSAENYNIKAGLTPSLGDSNIFRQSNTRGLTLGTLGIDSADLTFASGAAPSTANGDNRVLLYGIVGQAVVSGGNDVEIYIDDLPALGFAGAAGFESNVRTWYDGVGYKLAPEPSDLRLTITPATAPATGFELAWESQAVKRYNLRTSTDLTGPISTWSLVEGGIEATPPTNTFPVDPADPRRFYAVEEQVEP